MFDVLNGLRVVDLSQNLAGPYCGQILADFGADVLKVEPPGGDPARDWGPPFIGADSALFLAANRGKTSVRLDLKSDAGRNDLWAMLAEADVLVEAFRTGVMDRLGFPIDEVRKRLPHLICVSLSAFGRTGPGAEQAGYDPLVQAFTGILANTGHPDGDPARVGASLIDLGTGTWAATAVFAALRHRDQTGEGCRIDVSLLDTGLALMSYHLTGYLGTGVSPQRMGTSLALIAPYGSFQTSDGSLMMAAPNNGLFARLCEALDVDELTDDARFLDNPTRVRHRAELRVALEAVTRTVTTHALLDRLRDAGVPASPIQSVPEVVSAPEVQASDMLQVRDGAKGDYWDVALPVRCNGERAPQRSMPPTRPAT